MLPSPNIKPQGAMKAQQGFGKKEKREGKRTKSGPTQTAAASAHLSAQVPTGYDAFSTLAPIWYATFAAPSRSSSPFAPSSVFIVVVACLSILCEKQRALATSAPVARRKSGSSGSAYC